MSKQYGSEHVNAHAVESKRSFFEQRNEKGGLRSDVSRPLPLSLHTSQLGSTFRFVWAVEVRPTPLDQWACNVSKWNGLTRSTRLSCIVSKWNGLTRSERPVCIVSKWSGLTRFERLICIVSKWNGLTWSERVACIVSRWSSLTWSGRLAEHISKWSGLTVLIAPKHSPACKTGKTG